jgi:protein O-GlcNAc transferase
MCADTHLPLPCSILWLLRFPPYGEPHVKAEAAARGVDPARIIFTDVAAKPIHIARSGALATCPLVACLDQKHHLPWDVSWLQRCQRRQ